MDCGWSEAPEYDLTEGSRETEDGILDQFGGLTPRKGVDRG